MTLESLLAMAVTLFVIAIIPGPGVLAVTGCALGRGTRAALAMTVGLVLGDMVYLTLAVFGLAFLAQSMGDLFLAVRLAGAAYLVWLGVKLWRAPAGAALHGPEPGADRGFARNVLAGFAVTLGNPKVIAFYLGLLPTFVDLARVTPGDFAVLAGTVTVVLSLSVVPYAVAGGRLRAWMRLPHRVRWLNRGAGTIMIGTGAVLASKG